MPKGTQENLEEIKVGQRLSRREWLRTTLTGGLLAGTAPAMACQQNSAGATIESTTSRVLPVGNREVIEGKQRGLINHGGRGCIDCHAFPAGGTDG